MLRKCQAGQNKWVMVTDEPHTARILLHTMPVIGITGPSPEYSLWFGVSYLVWYEEDVDDFCLRRVWSRYYGEAFVLLEENFCDKNSCQNIGWIVREMKKKDLPELKKLYQNEEVKRFLVNPTGGDEADEAWEDWFRAYQKEVYETDEPAMWILASSDDRFLGRIGFEWQNICKTEGYFLGYALLPEKRGFGYVSCAAKALMEHASEWWGLEMIYLACHKTNQASAACAERLKFKMVCEDNDFLIFSHSL